MSVRFAACLFALVFALVALTSCPTFAEDTHAPLLYPITKTNTLVVPVIVLDISAAPEAQAWAQEAKTLMQDWFPLVWAFLATEKATPPKTIHLTFKHNIGAAGLTSGNDITIDADSVKHNPNDFGLVIHELTHVIQAYPDAPDKPTWLGEGIADYIRYWRYEPERPHPAFDVQKASYRDGYGTTGAFLAWLTWKYDRRIVHDLDAASRAGTYTPSVFEQRAKKPLDTLWAEFIADQKRP